MQGVLHGDCLELFPSIPDGSVSLVVADPPFNIGYEYLDYNDKLTSEEYLAWSKRWIEESIRVLKPGGSLWISSGDDYVAELKILASGLGLTLRNWVVWHYSFGVHCKKKFTRSHTHLLYFIKGRNFTFNDLEIRVPSARQLKYNDKRADPKGRVPDDTWTFPRICGTHKERAGFHGCQQPEQMLGRIIKACSNPDELVVDPFAGTASTLIVAKKLGRKYLGFELSQEYATQGQERIDATQVGDPLAGGQLVLA